MELCEAIDDIPVILMGFVVFRTFFGKAEAGEEEDEEVVAVGEFKLLFNIRVAVLVLVVLVVSRLVLALVYSDLFRVWTLELSGNEVVGNFKTLY